MYPLITREELTIADMGNDFIRAQRNVELCVPFKASYQTAFTKELSSLLENTIRRTAALELCRCDTTQPLHKSTHPCRPGVKRSVSDAAGCWALINLRRASYPQSCQ